MTQCLMVSISTPGKMYLYDAVQLTGKQDSCPYVTHISGYNTYRLIDEYEFQVLAESASPFAGFKMEEFSKFSDLFIILFITGFVTGLISRRLR